MSSSSSFGSNASTEAMPSENLPAKKRRGFWTSMESQAELDPLSFDVPEAKRLHSLNETPTMEAMEAPNWGDSVFELPTGRLEDRFELSDTVLGAGQYGSVRVCWDRITGEKLACKTLPKTSDALQREDLRNEVALMTRVAGHENVVQLRGVFEDEEEVHLVMDLCEGGELFHEILRRHERNEAPFTEHEAALLFAELVKATAYLTSREVMHRDLKPENLLLTRPLEEGQSIAEALAEGPLLKIADFGLSAHVPAGEKIRGSAGSPFYMAPEVLTGYSDCKADVWSLGVILYILLCGTPPFWGETDSETFRSIKKEKPDMSSSTWKKISSDAKGLIQSLLIKDPGRRPSAQKVLTHPWLVGMLLGGGIPGGVLLIQPAGCLYLSCKCAVP